MVLSRQKDKKHEKMAITQSTFIHETHAKPPAHEMCDAEGLLQVNKNNSYKMYRALFLQQQKWSGVSVGRVQMADSSLSCTASLLQHH